VDVKRVNQIASDMHNFQAAISEVNGDRSNYRYSLFTKVFNQYEKCKSAVDFKACIFQPRDEIRGMIARTYLYMSDKYKINLSNQEKKLIMAWNKMYAPENLECKRNAHIAKVQGMITSLLLGDVHNEKVNRIIFNYFLVANCRCGSNP
jgi:endonuclease I